MAQFPSSHSYNQPRDNNAHVIINGRRVPVGAGLPGRDLAVMAGAPGRRVVRIGDGSTRLLNPDAFYTPEELRDSRGRPVKISSIPDRTKGCSPAGVERVLAFLDFANVDAGARPFGLLDYGALLAYLAEGRFLVEAYAYVPIDPRRPEARRDLVRHLQESGWMVHQKLGKIAGDSYKSNVDMEMCIDMMRSAQQIRPDIMVLCSGDGDFLPVVRELRRMGIRAEVAAFEHTADASLPYEASGFISLDVWLRETQGADAESRGTPLPDRLDAEVDSNDDGYANAPAAAPDASPDPGGTRGCTASGRPDADTHTPDIWPRPDALPRDDWPRLDADSPTCPQTWPTPPPLP